MQELQIGATRPDRVVIVGLDYASPGISETRRTLVGFARSRVLCVYRRGHNRVLIQPKINVIGRIGAMKGI
jgi:hypothetical protein